ncbi:unnamed protein product [Owenia fusiformis]|uniref:C-type lectin domain-containing protein n=2 Tax=Owenia fusiformis TaxID=6347 RepID=A0A8S4PGK7_OWEFU|nr:unnamed protein product [Owenia fusiformis]
MRNRLPWDDARADCKQKGGDLLKYTTDDTRRAIEAHMVQFLGGFKVWTGLNKPDYPTASCLPMWRWGDGDYTHPSLSNINWDSEPNNAKGTEHCADILKDGKYNDLTCARSRGYICKYDTTGGICADEWESYGTSCYYFSTRSGSTMKSWDEAKTACRNMQSTSDLVWINSQSEMLWFKQKISDLFRIRNGPSWWTGLNNLPNGDKVNWKWNSDSNLADMSLIEWDKEPNNYGAREYCGLLLNDGTSFKDVQCSSERSYICQAPVGSGCVAGWDAGAGKCFQLNTELRLSWTDARQACMQYQGGDLLALDSPQDAAVIATLVQRKDDRFWTSLNDRDQTDRCHPWVWADGSKADKKLITWDEEPNNYNGLQNCGQIWKNGVFDNSGCSNIKPYVCEYDGQQSPCQQGWSTRKGHCYMLQGMGDATKYKNWVDARISCATSNPNADLVAFDDEDEMEYVTDLVGIKLLADKTISGFFVGLNRDDTNSPWKWNDDVVRADMSLIRWDKEPNDFRGENVAALHGMGSNFVDSLRTAKYRYICQKPTTKVNSAITSATINLAVLTFGVVTVVFI